ncbi:hypothetical protein SISSUDRAFT_389813 [Sistotremastrum suecicum HHB10207 ss-3]|uniref:DUF6697 domain-containing protein n=1 Tax=Sistotremastrum suecicum HHB10207 ss-3 TaxID=1314776 RepID=A0A165YWR4_9AGAM|nr:hypothetical protein SISSUDRAFT_389813 [Sistotremastrum suecicum HHB10207 ss-3]
MRIVNILPPAVHPHRPWAPPRTYQPVVLAQVKKKHLNRSRLDQLLGRGEVNELEKMSKTGPTGNKGNKGTKDKSSKKADQNGGVTVRVRLTRPNVTALALEHNVLQVLYTGCAENPDCPKEPGTSGFLYSGFGNSGNSFLTPHFIHLFVDISVLQDQTGYCYLGLYKCTRREPFSASKWKKLSDQEQLLFARRTRDNTPDFSKIDLEVIRAHYEAGWVLLPCLELQFVEYNVQLASALAEDQETDSESRKRKREVKAENKVPSQERLSVDVKISGELQSTDLDAQRRTSAGCDEALESKLETRKKIKLE